MICVYIFSNTKYIQMELNQDAINKNSFFNHIFSFNEEEKGEMLNVAQYGALGLIPVLILN